MMDLTSRYSDETVRKVIDSFVVGYESKMGMPEPNGALSLNESDLDQYSFLVRQRALWGRMFGQVISVQEFDKFALFPLPPGWGAFRRPSKPYPQSDALSELDKWVGQLLDRMSGRAERARLEHLCQCPFFWVRWAIYYAYGAPGYGVEQFYRNKTSVPYKELRHGIAAIQKLATETVDLIVSIHGIICENGIGEYLDDDERFGGGIVETIKVERGGYEDGLKFEFLPFKRSEVFQLDAIREKMDFLQGLACHAEKWRDDLRDSGGAPPVWRRRAFAAHMAAAYFFLTDELPTSTPTGDFAVFLDAAEQVYWDDMDPSAHLPDQSRGRNQPLPTKDILADTVKLFKSIDFKKEQELRGSGWDVKSYERGILPVTMDALYKSL